MLQVNFADNQVLFINEKTAKAEGFSYLERIDGKKAVGDLKKDVDGRPNLTRASLSVLIEILSADRLQAYKGKTAMNTAVPKEFKQAIRDVEVSILRPMLISGMKAGMDEGEKNLAADKYISELWAGGVYAMAKGIVSRYFCHVGKLPCVYGKDGKPDTAKLLSTDAMKRLIDNALEEFHNSHKKEEEEKDSFKDKTVRAIVKTAHELDTRDEKTNPPLEEVKSAIAALKAMLATYQGIEREYAELATKAREHVAGNVESVTEKTAKALDKASRKGAAARVVKSQPALM